MMRITTFFCAFALAVAFPVSAADKESPYLVDKRSFKKTYKTIALIPVEADPLIALPDSAARILEEEVTKHLEKRGFKVIPAAALAAIRATDRPGDRGGGSRQAPCRS